jgi:hypothetical protein
MSSDRKQIREALSSFRKSVREPNSDVQFLLEKYGAFTNPFSFKSSKSY